MGLLTSTNVIWGGTVGHAEEPNQAFTLDPMVVTATRTPIESFKTNADVYKRQEILLFQENLWLTQAKMAELFAVQKAAISKHLKLSLIHILFSLFAAVQHHPACRCAWAV